MRFAEIGAALGAVAAIGDRIAIGADRLVVAAESRQHRRQHVPAAAIGRDSSPDAPRPAPPDCRAAGRHRRCGRALRQRKIAELRRAERQIERDRQRSAVPTSASTATERRNLRFDFAGRSRSASAAASRRRPISTRAASASVAPIRPAGEVAIDLGELILVDGGLAAAGLRLAPRPSGHSTAKIAAAVISANTNHSVIKQVPGGTAPEAGADAPLYTTGGKPGN